MEKYIVIHSEHDKYSREFVASITNYKVINFYDLDNVDTINFKSQNIPISDFPSVVDTELKLVVNVPASMEIALTKLKATSESLISKALADMEFGKRLIALVRLYSSASGLTPEQGNTIEAATSAIISKLLIGKIDQAELLIIALVTDDVLITNTLKESVLNHIANYRRESNL